jgi:hypothetical protein
MKGLVVFALTASSLIFSAVAPATAQSQDSIQDLPDGVCETRGYAWNEARGQFYMGSRIFLKRGNLLQVTMTSNKAVIEPEYNRTVIHSFFEVDGSVTRHTIVEPDSTQAKPSTRPNQAGLTKITLTEDEIFRSWETLYKSCLKNQTGGIYDLK